MSINDNADKRIAQVLEKIKNSIEQKSKLELEEKENALDTSLNETPALPDGQEEHLDITSETMVITDRKFINLLWTRKNHQGLTFKIAR